jgi:hypothetical protein
MPIRLMFGGGDFRDNATSETLLSERETEFWRQWALWRQSPSRCKPLLGTLKAFRCQFDRAEPRTSAQRTLSHGPLVTLKAFRCLLQKRRTANTDGATSSR